MALCLAGAAAAIDLARFPVGTQVSDEKVARALLAQQAARPSMPWLPLSPADIPPGAQGDLIRYGMDLMSHTSRLIGPRAPDRQLRLSRNDLNCAACHQAGPSGLPGTKPFALPLYNASHDLPRLDVKSMKIMSLQMHIARMLGAGQVPVRDDMREVKALVAYIEWLGKGNPGGARVDGTGLVESVALPNRAADPVRGAALYRRSCVACHGAQGLGTRNPDFDNGGGYAFPPIAGDDAYDDGGHMYMVPLLSRFVYANMPFGASASRPQLTIDDAYDIAAYVNSALPRKHNGARTGFYPMAPLRPSGFVLPEQFTGQPGLYEQRRFGPFSR